MTDKMKSFLRKLKTNAKFANAGKGHKLTESTSSFGTASAVEEIKRVEPTQDAKTAGLAALARLDAKQNKSERFNTSYTSIKAQVRRELEQERKALAEAQKSSTQPEKHVESTVVDNTFLAVSNIFYRCPYFSDEVLPEHEWKTKIKEFLYEQLRGEEPGLIACLIIRNCNDRKGKIEACVDTLGKYLENIINNPEEEKYKKIRMQNKIFQEKVLPIDGALHFLKAAGFHQEKLVNNETEEDFLVWNSNNCSGDNLMMLVEALKSAECIPLELDRNIQVLLPSQASKKTELPLNFFNLTLEEISREQQQRTALVKEHQMLRTKAMREAGERNRLRKYKFSLIRIKFPDDLILQGTFSVEETFQNVINFVSESLIESKRPFTLIRLPKTIYKEDSYDKTLLTLELFPSILLMFNWKNQTELATTAHNESAGYLKEELLAIIQSC